MNKVRATYKRLDYNNGDFLAHYQWRVMQDSVMFVWKGLQDDEDGMWTTDGHFYLFSYIGMLMGLDYNTARVYGALSEAPDSKVQMSMNKENLSKSTVNEGDMEEEQTWAIGRLQQQNHALTHGEHGIELATTIYALKKYGGVNSSYSKFLYHRFGDCYAHFDIDDDSEVFTDVDLSKYYDAFQGFLDDIFKKVCFVKVGESNFDNKGDIHTLTKPNEIYRRPDSYFILTTCNQDIFIQNIIISILQAADNPYLKQFSNQALKHNLCYYNLCNALKQKLPKANQNDNKMYGDDSGAHICSIESTIGHARDGGKPDYILGRSSLFKNYAKKVAQLYVFLGIVGDEKKAKSASDKINSIIDFCKEDVEKIASGVYSEHNQTAVACSLGANNNLNKIQANINSLFPKENEASRSETFEVSDIDIANLSKLYKADGIASARLDALFEFCIQLELKKEKLKNNKYLEMKVPIKYMTDDQYKTTLASRVTYNFSSTFVQDGDLYRDFKTAEGAINFLKLFFLSNPDFCKEYQITNVVYELSKDHKCFNVKVISK